MEILQELLRWIHIVAGVIWIGHLYFFNFVNGPFATTMDGDTKKKVVPQLMPRALYWFRWGAAYTWVTGFLLLSLIFYHGANLWEDQLTGGWTAGTIVMILVTFGAFGLYDALAKSALAKNLRVFGVVGFVLTMMIVQLMIHVGGFGYRGYLIHTGAMFGTIMAANVWMRIWPAQRKIITAIRDGAAPDAAVVALAGARSRHNTYMSVPLLWTMINMHTTVFSDAPDHYAVWLMAAIVLGWSGVAYLYKKAGQVKGF